MAPIVCNFIRIFVYLAKVYDKDKAHFFKTSAVILRHCEQ